MSSLLISDLDLEATMPGVFVTRLPDALFQSLATQETATVAGLAGVLPVGFATVGARTFTVGLWAEGGIEDVRMVCQQIAAQCGPGYVPLRTTDRPGICLMARLEKCEPVADQPQVISVTVNAELTFVADHPYWRDLSALPYYLDGTARPLPGGTAPTSYLLRLYGVCENPRFVLLGANGVPIRSTEIAVTFADLDDYVEIVAEPEAMDIYHVVDGVRTLDNTLLPADELFPLPLDPLAYGNPYHGNNLLAKLEADSGTPKGEILYPRQWQ